MMTATRAAEGTATSAPTTPASSVPASNAMRTERPIRFTLVRMMRGVRKAFSIWI